MFRGALVAGCLAGWSSAAAAPGAVRAYQDVGAGVELGVAHAGGDIDLVAGVSRTAGKAARGFLSHHSGTGMTGGVGGTPAAYARTFDYEGFSSKVDKASEDVLQNTAAVTRAKLESARSKVLEEAFG